MDISLNEEEMQFLLDGLLLLSESTGHSDSADHHMQGLIGKLILAKAKAKKVKMMVANTVTSGYNRGTGTSGYSGDRIPLYNGRPNGIIWIDGPKPHFDAYARSQDTTEYIGTFEHYDIARTEWVRASQSFGQNHITGADAKTFTWEDGRYVQLPDGYFDGRNK